MKKFLVILLLAIGIGYIFGNMIFNQYEKEVIEAFSENENIYILQQGVYSSLENANRYTTGIDYYTVENDEQYYRVYVGITNSEENANKVKEIFLSLGKDIYVRELEINNKAFLELLDQYEKLLSATADKEEILQIEKQVLSKYEELVIRGG